MEYEAPPEIQDLAVACIRYVQQSLNLDLDFTPETLPILDHYLRALGDPEGPEIVALVAPAAGAYFGEVIARTLAGVRWHTAGEDFAGYRLEFERVFLHFNPIGQALEAIRGRTMDGYGAHLGLRAADTPVVEAGLARLGEVRDDDYYRLSTRFEVIEQVVVTLGSQMLATDPDGRFGPEAYSALAAEVAAANKPGGTLH